MAGAPTSNEWGLVIASVADGTRISNTTGASVTPGNNTYGSYTAILAGASVTDDAYGILINLHANNVSTAARDTLVTIGFDPAGGTSYGGSALTEIADLSASNASSYLAGTAGTSGHWYYFPIKIKAGTSIGAKATINNATVGTLRCQIYLYCQPSRPELVRYGTFVRTYGSTPATSTGTAVTSGTTSDGAWTQLGTVAAGDYPWAWEVGFTVNNGVTTQAGYTADIGIGDASTKKIAVSNAVILTSTAETAGKGGAPVGSYGIRQAAPGDIVYGRLQCSGTPDSGVGLIAYGVCG